MRERIGWVLLGVWAPLTVSVVGLLMVNHTIAMPAPTDLDRLQTGVAALVGDGPSTVHVIFSQCSCTDRLVDHLATRTGDPSETVVFVGEPRSRHEPLWGAGYRIVRWTQPQLSARLGIDAAPILLIAGAAGRLQYIGGYFQTPAAVRPLDVGLIASVRDGELPSPLPIFGCAVAPELQALVDALRLQR